MAGDFVMVQCATPRKPEVLRIASALDVPPAHAFGMCVMAWIWFDEQTENGRARGATEKMLDAVVSREGFSRALESVGWLAIADGELRVPRFDSHMGASAKKRAKNTKRQQKLRGKSVAPDARQRRDGSATKNNKSATKEEKRREERKEEKREGEAPPPRAGVREEFREAWNRTAGTVAVDEITFDQVCMSAKLIADEQFQRAYPIALQHFPLKAFPEPMTLTQFLREGVMGRIMAGDHDKPWGRQQASTSGQPALPKLAGRTP